MSRSKCSDVFRSCRGTRQHSFLSCCVSRPPPYDGKNDSIRDHPLQSEISQLPGEPLKMDISRRSWKVSGQVGGSIPSPCMQLIVSDLWRSMPLGLFQLALERRHQSRNTVV